ncbi:2-phospho-L-lactate guanylyltransferase [Methanogenium organophilum]|uniref:2-phospho-L-lactate guanylyltransferase n=1 Tax=Methanogenium organophilum TaxID=2199 RepID=A0A9X9S438_METOG|nr:2-phospho-L-lactate guanylyltransferase [Methanogenium organophilum]WAI01306.1 2-phospho-L-lactate guanylyltransferase [Methanogenium organophilum]
MSESPKIHAIIPFRPINPKTRLSGVMDQEERESFARAMLGDVISVLHTAGCSPCILSTVPFEYGDVTTQIDTRDLNEALNAYLSRQKMPVLIIMSDLPLVTPDAIQRLLSCTADVGIVPGRGGGTNVLYVRKPQEFRVDYYGASFCDHVRIAEDAGLSYEVIDSFFMSTDIDEKEDLVEILIHGMGRSRCFLQEIGIQLSLEHGRVGIQRSAHE